MKGRARVARATRSVTRVVVLVSAMLVASTLALVAATAVHVRPAAAATHSVTVPVTMNIFGAGLDCGGAQPADCPHPGGECPSASSYCTNSGGRNGGAAPEVVDISAGETYITFTSNQGNGPVGWSYVWSGSSVSACAAFFPQSGTAGTLALSGAGGLSGIASPIATMLHVGVFLADEQPGVAPPLRQYSQLGSYVAEAPELGQIFYIGTGTDVSTGAPHKIAIPEGATKLYLGWADGPHVGSGASIAGAPGYYRDNRTSVPPGCTGTSNGPLTGTVTAHTGPLNDPITDNERQSPSEDCFPSCVADPIDTASGAMSYPMTDFSVPNRGSGLVVGRTYNSVNVGVEGIFGDGWRSTYDMALSNNTPATDQVTITEENGAQILFNKGSNVGSVTTYYPDNGRILAGLAYNSSTTNWTFTRKRQEVFTFGSNGKLTKLQSLNELQAGVGTTIAYPAADEVTVTDSGGRVVTFNLDSTSGRVETIADAVGRTTTYTYDGSDSYLLSSTDPSGNATTFCYNVNPATGGCPTYDAGQPTGVLRVVSDPRGNEVTSTYDGSGRVTSQIDREGKTTSIDYEASPDGDCPVTGDATTEVTFPDSSDSSPDVQIDTYLDGQMVCQTKTGTGTSPATSVYAFDPATEKVSSITDPNGNVTNMVHDQWGNLTAITDSLGRTSQAEYNRYNQPLTTTDANGVTTTFEYHSTYPWLNTEISTPLVGTAEEQRSTFLYDVTASSHFGDLLEMSDPDQTASGTPVPWEYAYDTTAGAGDHGYVTALTDPENNTTSFTYDLLGHQTTTVSANGNTGISPDPNYRSVRAFDRSDRVAVTVNEAGDGIVDSFGRTESASSLGSADTGESWTASNGTWGVSEGGAYLASGTNGIATVTAGADGGIAFQLPAAQDGAGIVFRYADTSNYWKLTADATNDRLTLTQIASGSVTQTLNSANGTCCDPLDVITVAFVGGSVVVGVNGNGNEIVATDTSLSANTGIGLFAASTGSGLLAPFVYSGIDGDYVLNGYDPNGNPDFGIAADGGRTGYEYDNEDRLIRTNRPGGSHIDNEYYDNGLLAAQYDGSGSSTIYTGQPTTYEYDHVGRVTAVTDPDNRSTNYDYDRAGNVTRVRTPEHATACNPTATMVYDDANQLTQILYGTWTGGGCDTGYVSDASTADVTFTYDELGRRTSMTDGTGLSCYEWDSLGRLTNHRTNAAAGGGTCASPGGSTVTATYTYNLKNQALTVAYPGGAGTVSRSYDDVGRMVSTTDWNTNQIDFGYDRNSNLTSITYPTSTNDTVVTRRFDRANRLVDDGASPAIDVIQGATTRAEFSYARNSLGMLTEEASTISGTQTQSNTLGHDPLRQLTTVGTATYNYTTTQDAGYPSADNIRSYIFGSKMVYDANEGGSSNQPFEMRNALTNALQRSYTYDDDGRRTHSAINGGNTVEFTWNKADQLTGIDTASPVADYTYNGDNLRTKKVVLTITTNFQWDLSGDLPLLLRSGNGSNWDHYIYGPGGMPVERINITSGTATTHYIVGDQRNSTRLLLQTDGTVDAGYTYEPYGRVSSKTGTASIQLQFAGQWTDGTGESGFQYLRARYYDPFTAQFIGRDPLAQLTRSPYGYGRQSPLDFADPWGLAPVDDGQNPGNPGSFDPTIRRGAPGPRGGSNPRNPDYWNIDVGGNLPLGGLPVGPGAGVSCTISRYGQIYCGPYISIGTAGPGVRVGAGWVHGDLPTCEELDAFLEGWSFNASAGYGPTAGYTQTAYGGATEIGIGSPGAGISIGQSFQLPFELPVG